MKKAITIMLPEELCQKTREVVYWNPDMTMSGLVEKALIAYLESFDEYGDQPIDGTLKRGRRVKNNESSE